MLVHKMKKFKVVLEDGEDGYVVVSCPQLPGCISQGKNREEALRNIKEAIELYLEVIEERKQRLPKIEIAEVAVSA
jgi:predicted RNase H-like HicB family nuclease